MVIALIVVPVFIAIAVLFTARMDAASTLAVVSDHRLNLPTNSQVRIELVKTKPAESTLLNGKYAAIVTPKQNGGYQIETIKSTEDQAKIESYLATGKLPESNSRGTGTNILGFILMIIMSQAVVLMLLFPEDRIQKTFRRILTAPACVAQYLAAQGIFTFLYLFLPTFLAVAVTKVLFQVSIGFSLPMLALLTAILCAFSSSFALLMSSVMSSNASTAATGISMITCVLAGCYFSFTDDNKILERYLQRDSAKSLYDHDSRR